MTCIIYFMRVFVFTIMEFFGILFIYNAISSILNKACIFLVSASYRVSRKPEANSQMPISQNLIIFAVGSRKKLLFDICTRLSWNKRWITDGTDGADIVNVCHFPTLFTEKRVKILILSSRRKNMLEFCKMFQKSKSYNPNTCWS